MPSTVSVQLGANHKNRPQDFASFWASLCPQMSPSPFSTGRLTHEAKFILSRSYFTGEETFHSFWMNEKFVTLKLKSVKCSLYLYLLESRFSQ